MNFAIIVNDFVTNVIVADNLEIAKEVTGKECVECNGSFWIGWFRNGKQWFAPIVVIDDLAE